MPNYSYPKKYRLLKPHEFKAVFNAPVQKIHQSHIMAFTSSMDPVAENDRRPREGARLGMAITKKKVPTAVARNRVKRKMREQFRHEHSQLPNVDIVFIVKRPLTDISLEQLDKQVDNIIQKIINRANQSKALSK